MPAFFFALRWTYAAPAPRTYKQLMADEIYLVLVQLKKQAFCIISNSTG